MQTLRHIIGLTFALLFVALSATAMPLTPERAAQTAYSPQKNSCPVGHYQAHNTAGVPASAVLNLVVSGGVVLEHRNKVARHRVDVSWDGLRSDGEFPAPNRGTVWDNITSTSIKLPNTQIPVTFKLKSGDLEFYVNSNATKHMAEYLQKSSNPINDQQLLSSFSGAVDQISSSGSIKFNQTYNANGWEIVFNQRVGDGLPVIKHALYVP